jgi:hypothetical protein
MAAKNDVRYLKIVSPTFHDMDVGDPEDDKKGNFFISS